MSTTVTARNNLSVEVAWKCSKCGKYNHAPGVLVVSESVTVSNNTRKNVAAAENRVRGTLNSAWVGRVFGIIKDPVYNANIIRDVLGVQNKGKCRYCNNREIWAKKAWYKFLTFVLPAMIAFTLLAVLECISDGSFVVPLILLVAEIALFSWIMIYDKNFQKRLDSMSQESIPKILCRHPDLIDYAREKDYMRYIDEAFEYIQKADSEVG